MASRQVPRDKATDPRRMRRPSPEVISAQAPLFRMCGAARSEDRTGAARRDGEEAAFVADASTPETYDSRSVKAWSGRTAWTGPPPPPAICRQRRLGQLTSRTQRQISRERERARESERTTTNLFSSTTRDNAVHLNGGGVVSNVMKHDIHEFRRCSFRAQLSGKCLIHN